ncbi:MAG: amidase [Candidatus Hermodarchaeota archaeon]|nr:amidase [Candidatus Hermodarchaeota archaeon]
MVDSRELATLDATAIAEKVRQKEVTPSELVEVVIERIEHINPKINAVITPMFDEARKTAKGKLPKGPFTGVPFLLKDILAAYAGVRLSYGSAALKDYIPDFDSELVKRFKRAGLITVGKTNTPEFGLLSTTEPLFFGPTRNPWDTERTTGGSSGGTAAAVAAGIVPMAHASDGGGSIRIPASCCGVFGIKPTRARNPLAPTHGDIQSGLVVEHALTRSVRDSAALLDATAGPDVGDPYWAPPPKRPFLQEVGADPGKIRIAYTSKAITGEVAHKECVKAIDTAVSLCSEHGHELVEANPDFNIQAMYQNFVALWSGGVTAVFRNIEQLRGSPVLQEEVEPLTWELAKIGRQYNAGDYLFSIMMLQQISRDIARFFQEYDIWLTPTLIEPPVPLGYFDCPPEHPMKGFLRAGEFTPFTQIQNITGQPAMSMPLHWTSDGLPVGTHFVGRFGDEATLFRLAAQIEVALPWIKRQPPIHV